LALLPQAQSPIDGTGRRRFHQRVDPAATARDAAAAGVEQQISLALRRGHPRERALRLMDCIARRTQPPFLIAIRVAEQHALAAVVSFEMPPVDGLVEELTQGLATSLQRLQ